MTSVALGVYTYAEFFTTAVAMLPIMAISSARHRSDPTQRLPGRWMRRFGRITSTLTPVWDFGVEGTAPADVLSRAYVVVSNHESTADPFLLSFLPWDMRWVAKEEIFKMPLLGWLMRCGGDIPLRRGDRESVKEMFAECARTLERGMPVMMFPEGTRSPDGRLLPFKDGAFELAIKTQSPVLPLALAGTRSCRPKGSLWFGQARARVRVLEPISTEGMTLDDLAELKALVRERISVATRELREALGLPPAPVDVEAESEPAPPSSLRTKRPELRAPSMSA